MSLRRKSEYQVESEAHADAAIRLMKMHVFHGVWYNPETRAISVRRTLLDDIEHLPWPDVLAILGAAVPRKLPTWETVPKLLRNRKQVK